MSISKEESGRVKKFKRNSDLEELLPSLNKLLTCSESQALDYYSDAEAYPLVFVMGPLRSGTTLFMQWLASSGVVAYPSNLLSRFYGAPVMGAMIQLLLTDSRYNFRNEILDFNISISFDSENGKTTGALAPNEFWYFWRRFLPFKDLDWLPDDELHRVVDKAGLVNELETLTRAFGKPFALKGMILNYNIPFLDAIFNKAFFIQIKRDPVPNVASILDARKRQLGSESEWYSFKIPEYPELKDLDAISQSAGQLHYINAAINSGMEAVDSSRKLVVQYEDFCQNPRHVFEQLTRKLAIEKTDIVYSGPESFSLSKNMDVSRIAAIKKALAVYT